VAEAFTTGDAPDLERRLAGLVAGLRDGAYPVTEMPHRGVCHGCPAAGGLCSWPVEMTRRETPDRLF
jgi:hypothetical protein